MHTAQKPPLAVPVLGAPIGPSARAARLGAAGAPGDGGPRELQQLSIFANDAAPMPRDAKATAICGDARRLIVGFEDGAVMSMSWSAKVTPGGAARGARGSGLALRGFATRGPGPSGGAAPGALLVPAGAVWAGGPSGGCLCGR